MPLGFLLLLLLAVVGTISRIMHRTCALCHMWGASWSYMLTILISNLLYSILLKSCPAAESAVSSNVHLGVFGQQHYFGTMDMKIKNKSNRQQWSEKQKTLPASNIQLLPTWIYTLICWNVLRARFVMSCNVFSFVSPSITAFLLPCLMEITSSSKQSTWESECA